MLATALMLSIEERAADDGIRADQVTLAGSSAGGHIAQLAACTVLAAAAWRYL